MKYIVPELEVVKLEESDVITASGNNDLEYGGDV